jgi:flagellar biogenesis protein FliO
MLRQLLSVLLVFSLLGAALWALRRWSAVSFRTGRWRRQPARSRALHSVERLALSPQHSLHLVQIDGRRLVVATHPHGCSLLIETAKGVGA